jgi:hypothetical protein
MRSFCPSVIIVGCTRLCGLTFEPSLQFFRCPLTLQSPDHGQTSLLTCPLDSSLGRSASHTPCVVPGSIVQGYTQVTECQGWFVVLGPGLGSRTAATEGTPELRRIENITGPSVSVPLIQALLVYSLFAPRTPTGRRSEWYGTSLKHNEQVPCSTSPEDNLPSIRWSNAAVFTTEGEKRAASEPGCTVLGERLESRRGPE